MKLGPIFRFTKKMTLNKCGPGSGLNYGETAVCPLGREGNKWPKIRFSLYKHPQNGYSPLIIWEKGTFFFGQHCPVVAGTWLGVRNEFFLGARNFGILARKSVLCYRTPINGMFIALGVTVVLAPSDQFLNFTFRSYGCFCVGDPSHAAKSITPPHCRGTWVP